jgi:hypothetical protein
MAKMVQKSSIFGSSLCHKLSICECKKHNLANMYLFSGRSQSRFAPNRTDLCRDINSRLRTRQGALSKSPVLFERDRRKVSSLTTGIDLTHYKVSDTSQVQEQLAMKARCLTDCVVSYSLSSRPILGRSAGEPSMVPRRKN